MTADEKRSELETSVATHRLQNGYRKTNGVHLSSKIEYQDPSELSSAADSASDSSDVTGAVVTSPSGSSRPPARGKEAEYEECSLWVAFITYLAYGILVAVGYVKEFFFPVHYKEKNREGYTPLYSSFESFYIRNVYRRMADCFNNPLASCPGGQIDIQVRDSLDYRFSFYRTGEINRCTNFGSYNYLGFAESSGPCTDAAEKMIRKQGVSSCSTRLAYGNQQCQADLERLLADFLGVEDAITFSMGFATNALNMSTLVGRGCLVLSDQLNHASLILGLRLSGATIAVFKHNDMSDLERRLRQGIVEGQPRTHRPWRKILIVVEGIYSMEGTICNLPEILRLKKKYKAYVYLDEAHSIGALGASGRGVVEYWGLNPRHVDVMMGTFTKSFGAVGGYIAGSKRLIEHVRRRSHSMYYAASMPPPVAEQVSAVLNILSGRDTAHAQLGRERIQRLANNTRYFRKRLSQMGFILYGNDDSPVVPLLIFLPAKAAEFARLLREHNIATVIVGFPATPILTVRCRFCVSAAHTKEMLDRILDLIDQIGDHLEIKYSRRPPLRQHIEYGNC